MIPIWMLSAWHFLSLAAMLLVLGLLTRHFFTASSALESESVHHEDH